VLGHSIEFGAVLPLHAHALYANYSQSQKGFIQLVPSQVTSLRVAILFRILCPTPKGPSVISVNNLDNNIDSNSMSSKICSSDNHCPTCIQGTMESVELDDNSGLGFSESILRRFLPEEIKEECV